MTTKVESRKELANNRRLLVYTEKRDGNIQTRATVATVDGIWETHTLYKDFSKLLIREHCLRVSQKKLDEQHAKVDWESLLLAVEDHYA